MPKYLKQIQIAQLLESGTLSHNKIAAQVQVSKSKVQRVKEVLINNALTSNDLQTMNDEELKGLFKEKGKAKTGKESMYCMPDLEYCAKELLSNKKVTLHLLWEEYTEMCKHSGLIPYQLTQFKKYVTDYIHKKEFSEVIQHFPGDETEVDWTGDQAKWIDPDTGEIVKGWLFVGVLSFSGLAYAEVFPDMKQANWILAHVHMFEYFKGVTRVLVCDNLKTGVLRHTRDDVITLQEDYRAMGDHYNTQILAAKVLSPQYKPLAENAVGKLETELLARLRNVQCFSIEEYNAKLFEQLEKFNHKTFQKKEGSRFSAYENYEKETLLPLPKLPFEYFTKKPAKVQANCCISVEKNYYSVPHKHIGEKVNVKIFADRIEVWDINNREMLCSHQRVRDKIGIYRINNDHLPLYSSNYGSWNSERFKKWAREYGVSTYEVIDRLFSYGPEQKYYNGARSLLKLADTYSRERVESACRLALKYYKRPVYKNIKAILKNGQDLISSNSPQEPKSRTGEKSYVRGAEYYAGK